MNISEQFPHLLRASIFENLQRSFSRDFLDRCLVKQFLKPSQLLVEGEPATGVYIIAHGTVDIYNSSHNGHRVLLHRAGQGEIIGDLETLAETACAASCETGRNATLLVCPKFLLLEAHANAGFLRNMSLINYNRVLRSNQFKVVDNCYPIKQRLCAYLLYLSGRKQVITENQSFLAELIGCSRQTVNRELKDLRDEGVIETRSKWIEVANMELLQSYAGIITP